PVLPPVGLLPAAVAGVDVEGLLAGAAYVDERARAAAAPLADPALALAGALFLLATRHAKPILVLMPYCERLAATADWFCQLWAESLGKARDLAGRTVEWGPAPVGARRRAGRHRPVRAARGRGGEAARLRAHGAPRLRGEPRRDGGLAGTQGRALHPLGATWARSRSFRRRCRGRSRPAR